MATTDFWSLHDRITEKRAEVKSVLDEMDELSRNERMTDGQTERFQRLDRQASRLNAECETLESEYRTAGLEAYKRGELHGEHGGGIDPMKDQPATGHRIRHKDPWGELSRGGARTSADARSLAISAVERSDDAPDEARQWVTELLEEDATGDTSSWALASSDPNYRSAFSKLLRDPSNGHRLFTPVELEAFQRADQVNRAMSLSDGAGGYLIPFEFDPNINITNVGVIDPMRQLARVVKSTTDVWRATNSAGTTAEWIAEATEVADASPTLEQPSITNWKADVFVPYSVEIQGDALGLENELRTLMADAKTRLEAAAFTNGSGVGQPFGICTRIATTTASRVAGSSGSAGAADLVSADIYNVASALPPRHQANASWLANYKTGYAIRQLAQGAGPSSAFWAQLGDETPARLLGRPFHQSSEVDATIVSGSSDSVLLVGDFSQYVITDRVGATVELIPHLMGSNRRPLLQRGLVMWWRVGGDAINIDAFRALTL